MGNLCILNLVVSRSLSSKIINKNGVGALIAVISYFDSNPEPLNCESVVAEKTATSRDGFYFVPLNKDDVPLGAK